MPLNLRLRNEGRKEGGNPGPERGWDGPRVTQLSVAGQGQARGHRLPDGLRSRAGEEEEEQAWRGRASWEWVGFLTPISTPRVLPIWKKVLKPPF